MNGKKVFKAIMNLTRAVFNLNHLATAGLVSIRFGVVRGDTFRKYQGLCPESNVIKLFNAIIY